MVAAEALPQEIQLAGEFQQPVDIEHTGIRAAGCGSFLTIAFLAFVLFTILIPTNVMIPLVLAFASGALGSIGLERYLKGRWLSGREIVASAERIALMNKSEAEQTLDPQQQINVLTWYFVVKRGGRVKKGWYVLAIALEQEGGYIPIYTFMSPTEFKDWELAKHFIKLEKIVDEDNKKGKEKTKSVMTMRRAGEQRRLLTAEHSRGILGAELTLEQFKAYLDFLQKHYPDWMFN